MRLTTDPHSSQSRQKQKRLSRHIMLFPLLASCLLILLVYTNIISAPFTEEGLSFARILFFDAENTASGLLVDLVWWQSLGSSLSLAIVYSLFEVALGLLLIALVKDHLPYTATRLSLLATVWLVPLATTNQVLSQLIEQTNLVIPQWQVNGAASIWRNSSLASCAIYLLWPQSLKDNKAISIAYRLSTLRRITVFLSQARHMLLITITGLLLLHFSPADQWMQVHSQRALQAINPSLDYLQHASAAQSLSLVIESVFLLTLVIAYIRRPTQ